MKRRSLFRVLALSLAVFALGCGPTWQVVRQASPNPMHGSHTFLIMPVSYEGLHVGRVAEADYLARKNPEQQAAFQNDKVALAAHLIEVMQTLRTGGTVTLAQPGAPIPPDAFVITPHVIELEPGYNIGISRKPARVLLAIVVGNALGVVLDEVRFEQAANGSNFGSTTTRRLEIIGDRLAAKVGEYLRSRTGAP